MAHKLTVPAKGAGKTTNKLHSKPGAAQPRGARVCCDGSPKKGTAGEGMTTPKGWRSGRDKV
jgi:hypothetical protein